MAHAAGLQAAYPTYTAAQQPAKEFLAMLPTEDFLAMYQKICKVDCPANGNIESSASVSQPPTDSVDVMDMRTASLSTADRAKMERNLLRSAQSPHDFLASIKLPLLTGFLQKKGIDVAALQGHLKRTSDWVNIILTKWQNKDATLQVRFMHVHHFMPCIAHIVT